MAHTEKQLEIIDFLNRFPINESTIARWIGIKPNILSYQLNDASEIKDKYYNAIKKNLIDKKYLSDKDECQELFNLTTDFFGSVTTQFNMYKNEVMRTIQDKRINREERPRLRTKLDDFRNEMNRKCDEIIKAFGL